MENDTFYDIMSSIKSFHLISSIFVIFVYVKVVRFIKKPGDFFFMISFNHLIYSVASLTYTFNFRTFTDEEINIYRIIIVFTLT